METSFVVEVATVKESRFNELRSSLECEFDVPIPIQPGNFFPSLALDFPDAFLSLPSPPLPHPPSFRFRSLAGTPTCKSPALTVKAKEPSFENLVLTVTQPRSSLRGSLCRCIFPRELPKGSRSCSMGMRMRVRIGMLGMCQSISSTFAPGVGRRVGRGKREGRDETRAFSRFVFLRICGADRFIGLYFWGVSVSFEFDRELPRVREDGEGRRVGWFGGRRWVLRR